MPIARKLNHVILLEKYLFLHLSAAPPCITLAIRIRPEPSSALMVAP